MTFDGPPPEPRQIATGVAPPHSIEAEQSVLGGILLSDAVMPVLRMQEGLAAEHFYRDRHRAIFAAMCALNDRGAAVDVLTVTVELEQAGKLEHAGGKAAIDELTGGVPGLGGIRRYAQIVIEHWVNRERIAAAYEQLAAILNHAGPDAYDAALQRAHTVVAHRALDGYLTAEARASDILDWLANGDEGGGLPVPPELSTLGKIARFRESHTTFLGGWSHHGKSLLVGMLADYWAFRGIDVGLWTNEDSPRELTARQVQRITGISAVKIGDRALSDVELGKIPAALTKLQGNIQSAHGWTAEQIAASIRQKRPAAAIVDHLHKIAGLSQTSDIDEAMKVLTGAAGQVGCHLFILGQLNHTRDVAAFRPPPVIRDIRGSGLIHDLCENVLFLYRDEEELKDDSGKPMGTPSTHDTGRIIVAKGKAGARLGAFPVVLDRRFARFVEPARGSDAPLAHGSPEDLGF